MQILLSKHFVVIAQAPRPRISLRMELSLGKGTRRSRSQWREAPLHCMGSRHSVNEGRNSTGKAIQWRGFGHSLESPDSKNWNSLRSSPSQISAPIRRQSFSERRIWNIAVRRGFVSTSFFFSEFGSYSDRKSAKLSLNFCPVRVCSKAFVSLCSQYVLR